MHHIRRTSSDDVCHNEPWCTITNKPLITMTEEGEPGDHTGKDHRLDLINDNNLDSDDPDPDADNADHNTTDNDLIS